MINITDELLLNGTEIIVKFFSIQRAKGLRVKAADGPILGFK